MRIFLLILLLAAPLAARDVTVVALDVSAGRKMRLENAVESAFEHVEKKTGLADQGSLTLTLVGDARRFEELAARDGVGLSAENVLGYADSAGRKLALNLAAIDARRLSETGVLRHEIAHLVMGSALLSKRPLWFEEGMAQWVENMPFDALMESAGNQFAPPTYKRFDELDAGLRDDREAGAAYQQARSVIEIFVKRYGEARLRALLKKLSAPGVGFSAAFKEATGDELRTFEREALGEIAARQENWWVLFLGANWWWMLFTLGAVLAFIAWRKRKRRTKELVDQWEEQEKLYPSDPSWSYAQEEGDNDPTRAFREGIERKIDGAKPSDEGLKHWYDARTGKEPAGEAPSAEELKQWLDDDKPKA